MSPPLQSSPAAHQSPLINPNQDTNQQPTTITPDDDPPAEHQEARPTHTAEIGTLKKLSVPGGTAWLGSSSGVYFVNTVRRAFSAAFASTSSGVDGDSSVPASEDIITGEDATGRSIDGFTTPQHATRSGAAHYEPDFFKRIIASVGRPPADQKLAMNLVTTFFRQTHPLFPFLHGPKFLEDMNEIYTAMAQPVESGTEHPYPQSQSTTTSSRKSNPNTNTPLTITTDPLSKIDPIKLITFQIIINIAALSHPHPHPQKPTTTILPSTSQIPSAPLLLTLILPLSTTPLLPTIQLLLSSELYLLSTTHLRHSSTLAGIVLRQIYHAGLHRCPLRYASLSPQDCEIRKRVFWSAYALDRHLSLALGDPNTFQDSDIDVCLGPRFGGGGVVGGEGGEMHRRAGVGVVGVPTVGEEDRGREIGMHFPRDGRGRVIMGEPAQRDRERDVREGERDTQDPATMNSNPNPSLKTQLLREAALTAYVRYGKLTGRIIEIFHKSINFRFPKHDAIAFLTADIENWWNDLPGSLSGDDNHQTPTSAEKNPDEKEDSIDPGLLHQHHLLTPFFTLLYHQLLLLLNRPRFSLDQSTAEFQHGLQVCIRASRNTLTALKRHAENGQSMFLPGLLSAAWMAGLIIAFACQLGKYPKQRAVSDIEGCLEVLGKMDLRWFSVRNCYKVLELLVGDIRGRKRVDADGFLVAGRNEKGRSGMDGCGAVQAQQSRKRIRDEVAMDTNNGGELLERSPKREKESLAGVSSPITSGSRPLNHHVRPSDVRPGPANISASPMQAQNVWNHDFSASSNVVSRHDPTLSTSSFDFDLNNQVAGPDVGTGMSFNDWTPSNGMSNPDNGNNKHQHPAGAALYADPQDMVFAQSSHSMGLPELSSSMDDQMFWGNMDSNLFDVFGAVSWETMTGPVGPMVSDPNAWDMSLFANAGGDNGSSNDPQANGRFL